MKIECPGCGVSGSVNDSYSGRKIRCPKCGEVFRCGTLEASPEEDSSDDSILQQADETEPPNGKSLPPDPVHDADGQDMDAPLLDSSSTGAGPPAVPATPEAGERQSPGVSRQGTPESFTLGSVISRSWELTSGAKGQIWIAIVIMLALLIGLDIAAGAAGAIFGVHIVDVAEIESVSWGVLVYDFISSVLSTIITAGIMYMGVTWVRDRQISWRDAFSGFPTALSIVIAMVLQFILLTIGYFLLILPGIYLTVGYSMTMPLIIDKRMSPWQAMEASRQAVHDIWWKMFGLMLVMVLIISLSAIPFGIGLIWTVPMGFVLSGLVYSYLFPQEEIS